MSREIKFRAWDGEKYLQDVNVSNSGRMMLFEYGNYAGQNDYPLEQYTGLKDKNGVEIYEGDVVKFKCYGHEYTDTVEYQKWGYFPMASVDERIALSADGEVEIIGNIHTLDTNT